MGQRSSDGPATAMVRAHDIEAMIPTCIVVTTLILPIKADRDFETKIESRQKATSTNGPSSGSTILQSRYLPRGPLFAPLHHTVVGYARRFSILFG
jgi:hypothetical protein